LDNFNISNHFEVQKWHHANAWISQSNQE
jgi:hypothetical protein